MILDAAQFVELGGKTVVDYAAVAQPYGGLGQDGLLQLLGNAGALREDVGQGIEQTAFR